MSKKYNTVNKNSKPLYNSSKDYTPSRSDVVKDNIRTYGPGIFDLVLLSLLIVLIVRVLLFVTSGNDLADFSNIPTVSSLLDLLTNLEPAAIPFIDVANLALGDWGLFNFLRDFISALLNVVNVLVFIVNGISTLISYVITFIRWIFVL